MYENYRDPAQEIIRAICMLIATVLYGRGIREVSMMTDPLAEDSELMGERLWSRGTDHIECEMPERRLEPPRELDLWSTDEPHQ